MADLKYIMQGFQEDINFFDEIKEVLEKDDFTSVWILTAFINERAIYNLMPSIKKSKADISFIIGISILLTTNPGASFTSTGSFPIAKDASFTASNVS